MGGLYIRGVFLRFYDRADLSVRKDPLRHLDNLILLSFYSFFEQCASASLLFKPVD